jgi:protein O-mannosyl-transferase
MKPPWWRKAYRLALRAEQGVIDYFAARDPWFKHTIWPLLLLSIALFVRSPWTNYIFDEQEALLANPYVNASKGLTFFDAIHVDFWGLPPNASIGSYRPIPDLVWRSTWGLSKHPWFHHLYNLVFHAMNGAFLGAFAFAVTRRRLVGWLAAVLFVACGVITEAVSGIVGIADVLGGLGAILAVCALRLPARWMPLGVFGAITFGLFCKESALVCVPLVPSVALLTAHLLHPQRPARWLRFGLSLVAGLTAFVLYVELRKQWFPSPLPAELKEALPADAPELKHLYRDLLVWFHQAPLPKDPLNNPLAKADTLHRIAGALRVYWRGLVQVLLPLHLSGDYSFPQEPIPKSLREWETIAGGIMMTLPLGGGLGLMLVSWLREYRDKKRVLPAGPLANEIAQALLGRGAASLETPLVLLERRRFSRALLERGLMLTTAGASGLLVELWLIRHGSPHWVRCWPVTVVVLLCGIGTLLDGWRGHHKPMDAAGPWPWRHLLPVFIALGGVWVVVSYFPHSNIPVVLPTVRAERFWYFPVIGSAPLLAVLFGWLHDRLRRRKLRGVTWGALVIAAFVGMQSMQAYRHSMDYRDDLAFWHATKLAVPNSAKAHLNYSVMVGARGDLETRLVESRVAVELAPEWPMARIYTGDTLCRLHRAREAWPHYAEGFDLGPDERSLISLALQCMYDEKVLTDFDKELRAIADKHSGSWIAYLAVDTLDNHEEHKGVDPQYRPRGYNEGPKD